MSIAYFNGSYMPLDEVRISPLDRGFLFADGVYEVIPFFEGEGFGLDGHIRRLEYSLNAIKLPVEQVADDWVKLAKDLVAKNGGGDLSVYLQITRGAYSTREHVFPSTVIPTVFAMVSPIKSPLAADSTKADGISAVTLSDIRWDRCDIKSISLLPNILLKQQAADAGAKEAILIRNNIVTECAAANVFMVKNGTICTPEKGEHILGGITREIIIGLALNNGIPLQQLDMPLSLLESADEIWISSSTREIVPIVELNGRVIADGKPGPVWKLMAGYYQANKKHLFS